MTADLLLKELYAAPQDAEARALAARSAPLLRFDAREPFLPLAAGYTIFEADGPSASFDRMIELRPENQPPADRCVEYAIWWDWDIHHLYELEHVWVYMDAREQPVRLEASWHGKFYAIPLQRQDRRVMLLSEPGKHAFAPDISWFRERAGQVQRVETRQVSAQAGVLVNAMFAGKIRQRVFDRTLARSYLTSQAFEPSWAFSKTFIFPQESLVPWEALSAWIPRRVNAWLEHLESTLRPQDYRALQIVSTEGSLPGLERAAQAGSDAVVLTARVTGGRLVLGSSDTGSGMDFDDVFRFCRTVPMGAFFHPLDIEAVDRLAWYVRSHEVYDYAGVLSSDPVLLSRYQSFIPQSMVMVQQTAPKQDPLDLARQSGAQFIFPAWDGAPGSFQDGITWLQTIHRAGLGAAGGPVGDRAAGDALQRLGFDVVWQKTLPGTLDGRGKEA